MARGIAEPRSSRLGETIDYAVARLADILIHDDLATL